MKLIKYSKGFYVSEDESIKLRGREFIDKYKQHENVIILDDNGIDITKEELLLYVMGSLTNKQLINFIAEKISDDELHDMIYAGGFENWATRRRIHDK